MFLIRHETLKQDRIAKRIKKGSQVLFGKDFREMNILKDLKHEAIPTLYDCIDDEEYIWLIEEYIEGPSLEEYLKQKKSISFDEACKLIIKICEVLQYLHEAMSLPILYRDLKPEHIIVRGNDIALIDYGAALFDSGSGVYEPYGTPGYIPPETLRGRKSDVRGDIYSLGVISGRILSHVKGRIPYRAKRLLAIATAADVESRVKSVEEYANAWSKIVPGSKADGYAVTDIAVAGISPSCGVTHIAVSLVVYLNSIGKGAYYAEPVGSDVCNILLSGSRGFKEKEMVVYCHDFKAVRAFDEGIEQPEPPCGIRVLDAGCDMAKTRNAQLVILVVGSRPWQNRGLSNEYVEEGTIVIVNPSNAYMGRSIAQRFGRRAYAFPLDEDAFCLTLEKKKLFEKIMQNV